MAERMLARRYARAFIEIAEEADAVESLGADLDKALAAVRAHEDLLFTALANPVFAPDERRRVLDEVIPRIGLHPLVQNLLRLLLAKGRFDLLPLVEEEYRAGADARAGRVRVVVETAEPLGPQLEAEVRATLERVTGKTVLLDTRVEPALIGGMVARLGGKVYDASVRNRLDTLRNTLLNLTTAAEA